MIKSKNMLKRSTYTIFALIISIFICLSSSFSMFDYQPNVASFSMGGCLSSTFIQPSDVGINPALIAFTEYNTLETSFSRLHWGLDYGEMASGFLGYAVPIGVFGTVGINTRADFEGLMTDFISTVYYGNSFIYPGRVGLGVGFDYYTRFVRSNEFTRRDPSFNDGTIRLTMAVNSGLIVKPADNLLFGLSVFNLNRPKLSYGGDGRLPLKARADIGVYLGAFRPSASVGYIRHWVGGYSEFLYKLGFEVGLLNDCLQVRAGYDMNRFSSGVGINLERGFNLIFDYAFQIPLGEKAIDNKIGTHRVGLTFAFGDRDYKFKERSKRNTFLFKFNDVIVKEVVVRTKSEHYEDEINLSACGEISDEARMMSMVSGGEEVRYGTATIESNLKANDIAEMKVACKVDRSWFDELNVSHDAVRFHLLSDRGEFLYDCKPTLAYIGDRYYCYESEVDKAGTIVVVVLPREMREGERKLTEKIEEIEMLIDEVVEEEREREAGEYPKRHIVVKGECLFIIAGFEYHDPFKWRRIYEANMDKIMHPHWIYPGQEFIIPAPE